MAEPTVVLARTRALLIELEDFLAMPGQVAHEETVLKLRQAQRALNADLVYATRYRAAA